MGAIDWRIKPIQSFLDLFPQLEEKQTMAQKYSEFGKLIHLVKHISSQCKKVELVHYTPKYQICSKLVKVEYEKQQYTEYNTAEM